MNDETKNPDSQFLAGTDIEYQYSKEHTNTYYFSLFFFDVEKKSETYTLTQIDMQTCYVILPYICKFPQLPKMCV